MKNIFHWGYNIKPSPEIPKITYDAKMFRWWFSTYLLYFNCLYLPLWIYILSSQNDTKNFNWNNLIYLDIIILRNFIMKQKTKKFKHGKIEALG